MLLVCVTFLHLLHAILPSYMVKLIRSIFKKVTNNLTTAANPVELYTVLRRFDVPLCRVRSGINREISKDDEDDETKLKLDTNLKY